MGQTDSSPAKLPGSPGKLNVILHGLLAFDQETKTREEITVYIPDMQSEHVYKAGNWLAETTLAKGDFKLRGVMNGSTANKLDKARNIVLGDVPVQANPKTPPYATLRLPYPSLPIQSLRRLTIPERGLAGKTAEEVLKGQGSAAAKAATVQVLTYAFESDASLSLGNHPWEPVLEDGYVNLHVFSEPERSQQEQHLRDEFQASVGLFQDVGLSLEKPAQPADLVAEKKEIPPGVHELELESLLQRQRRLAVLGRAIKESRDLNTIWDDPTPFDGSDGGSCSEQPSSDS